MLLTTKHPLETTYRGNSNKRTKMDTQSIITTRKELWEKCSNILKRSKYYIRICHFFDVDPNDFVMTDECINSLLSEIQNDDLFFFFSVLKNGYMDHSTEELTRFLTVAVKIKDVYDETFYDVIPVLNDFYCKRSLQLKTNLTCLKLTLHYLTPSGEFDDIATYKKAFMSSCVTFSNWLYNAITPSIDMQDALAIIDWITYSLCITICDGCEVPDRDIQYMRATFYYHVMSALQNKTRLKFLLQYKKIPSFLKIEITKEEQEDWNNVLGVINEVPAPRRISFIDPGFLMQSFALFKLHPIFGSLLEFNKCVVYGETLALPMYKVNDLSKTPVFHHSEITYCDSTKQVSTLSSGIMITCVMGKFLRMLKEIIKQKWSITNKTPIDYALINPEIFLILKISDPNDQYKDVIVVVVHSENVIGFVNNIDSCLFQVVYDGETVHCTPNHALAVFSGVDNVVLTDTPSPFILQHANHSFIDMWKMMIAYRNSVALIIPHNKARTDESHLTRTLDFTEYINTRTNTQQNQMAETLNNTQLENSDDVMNHIDALIRKHDTVV